MKKKENFLEFQIILFTIHDNSRFAVIYINIARIQNRPCSQHRSIHVLVPNCNSKNRKTYHNCTTRVLHTVISTQSPSIDSNDYSSSPPFFFLPFHFLFHYHHRVIFHFSFLTFALLFCLCSGSWWYRWRCRQRGDRRRRRRREGRTSDAGARERDRHLMPRRRRKLSPVSAGFVGLLRGPGRIAD